MFRAPPPNPSPAPASSAAPAPPLPASNECWSPLPAPSCPAPTRFTFIPCVTTLDWTPPRRVIPPPLSLPLSPPSPTPADAADAADALNNNLPSPAATTPGSTTTTTSNINNYCGVSAAPVTTPTASSSSRSAAPPPPRKTSKRGGLRSLLSPTSSAPPRLGVTRSTEVNADVRSNGLAFNDNYLWGDNNNGEESEYVLTVHGWKPRGQAQGAVVLSPGEYPAHPSRYRSHRNSDANEDSLARPLLTRTRSGSAASTDPQAAAVQVPPPAPAAPASPGPVSPVGPGPPSGTRLGHRRLNSTSSSRTESDISSASGFHQRHAAAAGAATPPTPRPALKFTPRPVPAGAGPQYTSMARPLGIPPVQTVLSTGSAAFSRSWRLLGGGDSLDSPVSPLSPMGPAGLMRGCWDCTSQARPLLVLVNRGRVGQPGPNEYQYYPYP